MGDTAQVQLSLEGKYGMVFSGKRPSSASHFLKNVGHEGDVLGWLEPLPHETQSGGLSHLSVWWNSLLQLAHFSTPMQVSRTWPYS